MSDLIHYGVPGMKWGVRRYQKYGEGGYNPKNKGRKAKEKKPSAREIAKSLSDSDLQNAIDRMKKENEYVKLSSENVTNGKEFWKMMGITFGTTLAATMVGKAAQKSGEAIVAEVANLALAKDVFKAIYPKK